MKSPKMMYGYAAFLIVCALAAYAISGFASVTALIPAAMGVVMAVLGWMAAQVEEKRAIGMIGIHVGLVLPLVFAIMFAERAYRQFTADEPVMYLAVTFAVLCIGSIAAFIAILLTRPKPEQRGG